MSIDGHSHSLPVSLQQLVDLDFYPDHLNSMTGFIDQMHDRGMCKLGMDIVEIVAAGFLKSRQFDPWGTMADCPDNDPAFTRRWRSAVAEIHEKYQDRLPVQFYQIILFSGVRSRPEIEVKIPEVEHLLPDGMSWQVGDGVEHSLPLCTRLYMDVQTILYRHAGSIMIHGCGCGNCAPTLSTRAIINIPMSDDAGVGIEETESVVRHFMSQLILLHWNLPHSIGPSMTSQMIDLRTRQRRGESSTSAALVPVPS
jgi:hypothetical protein